jgi:hypothetical protein
MVAVGAVVLTAAPAQASQSPVDLKFRSVWVTNSGSVAVAFAYACPREQQASHANVGIEQPQDSVYASKRFTARVICDGTTHSLVTRVPPPTGQQWGPSPLYISLSIATSDFGTSLQNTFVASDKGWRHPAEIHVADARLTNRWLIITLSYRCAKGYFPNHTDDDNSEVSASQEQTGAYMRPIDLEFDIVCDGTWNAIVKRTDRGLFSSEFPINVFAFMLLNHPTRVYSLFPSESVTLLVD